MDGQQRMRARALLCAMAPRCLAMHCLMPTEMQRRKGEEE